ncbi:MAG: FtsX-like permease family protein [Gemmatimonadota bacterium]
MSGQRGLFAPDTSGHLHEGKSRLPLTPVRNLSRHPFRTALSLLGIAVTAAMLLDMVMLSGGIERSFEQLLVGRGFQMRISPKGTLPFDTEATLPGTRALLARLRGDPDIAAAGPLLGASLYARQGDSLRTLFGYGVDPAAQANYQLEAGTDLLPGDTTGVLISAPVAAVTGARLGDTLTLVGRLDPQMAEAAVVRRLVVRGRVRWLYDYEGQRSVGTMLSVMQDLARQRDEDRASAIVLKVREGVDPGAATARLRRELPALEVNSVADLVAEFRGRLVYFRQLSYILGTISLIVTLLLVSTLLTITVNERLGEIATLRAIGVARVRIVRMVMAEGGVLTLSGGGAGIVLGVVTARYLDAILTSFPGLPAAISFFVPRAGNLTLAALVLIVTGIFAGSYPAWLAARAPVAATLRAEAT